MGIKKEINITVSGLSCVGKTRLMHYLMSFLKNDGFEVNFDSSTDYNSKEELDKLVSNDYLEVIQNIKTNTEINFKEKGEYFDIALQKNVIKSKP